MALNKQSGNMYSFISDTWNSIKGRCPHDCSYCFMKRFGKLGELHLDESELRTNLSKGKFIFVGSSCDMFARDIPDEWIEKTLAHCREYDNVRYLFQSKDTRNMLRFESLFPSHVVLGTTIESNRWYSDIMNNAPTPGIRASGLHVLSNRGFQTMITLEPIMDFDLDELMDLILKCNPSWVNIGADSQNCSLPAPSKEQIFLLIKKLKASGVPIHQKKNLNKLGYFEKDETAFLNRVASNKVFPGTRSVQRVKKRPNDRTRNTTGFCL